MKKLLVLIIFFVWIDGYSQCGREYPNGFYHNSKFLSPSNDTLNNIDSSGLYDGLHVYTDNPNNLYDNSHSYLMGRFQHGIPIDNWVDHCNDGSFSMGEFECGSGESSQDGKGGYITKKQGIYDKIGIWHFYDKKGKLIKTLRYDRKINGIGWQNETYLQNKDDDFILIKYEFMNNRPLSSPFKKIVKKEFDNNGKIISLEFQNFWKDVIIEYYENAQIKESFKCRKFFGIKTNHTISKSYSQDGKLINKEKR